MLGMRRSVRQKVVAGAAVAVLLAGGAFAAVSATGQGNGHRHAQGRHGPRHLRPQDIAAAAAYLGVSAGQLSGELGSSRSLAQIADAHRGKSAHGVVEAIVAARKAQLAKVAARLPGRVSAEVNRPVGPPVTGARRGAGHNGSGAAAGASALGLFTAAGHLGTSAADYLGLTPARLRADLRSGRTLAQLASSTPGKSKAGLVQALVAAKQQRLAGRVVNGRVTRARAARMAERLRTRMNALVGRRFVRSATP